MQIVTSSKLVGVKEAALTLGLKESTMRAWILRRKIGYTKIGAAVRIPSSEIEKIISRGFVPAREETR